MNEETNVDKEVQLRYLDSTTLAGFGLWWACMLISAFLPDSMISEDGRMWVFLSAIAYGVVVLGSMFWTGYSRREREIANASAVRRKKNLRQLSWSAVTWFFIMLVIGYIAEADSLLEALIQAVVFATAMT